MKAVIARLNPITNSAIVFLPETLKDSQLDAFVDGQVKRVGWQFYQHSQKLTRDDAVKVAKMFAEHEGIPLEEIHVRERMPKTNVVEQVPAKRQRLTNDANLVLAHDSSKGAQESSQDYRSKQEKEQSFTETVQALHDGKEPAEEKKATAEEPEGAVVQKPRQKRKYNKKNDKEISARSRAALAQFHKEVAEATKNSETIMQPAVADPKLDEEFVKEQKLIAAMKIAKEVLGEPSPRFIKAIMESGLL